MPKRTSILTPFFDRFFIDVGSQTVRPDLKNHWIPICFILFQRYTRFRVEVRFAFDFGLHLAQKSIKKPIKNDIRILIDFLSFFWPFWLHLGSILEPFGPRKPLKCDKGN